MFKLLLAASSIIAAPPHHPEIPPITRPAQTIYVPEDYDVMFDARPGDTIIVIMYPDHDPVDRCLKRNGEPIWNPYTLIWTCEGVDF